MRTRQIQPIENFRFTFRTLLHSAQAVLAIRRRSVRASSCIHRPGLPLLIRRCYLDPLLQLSHRTHLLVKIQSCFSSLVRQDFEISPSDKIARSNFFFTPWKNEAFPIIELAAEIELLVVFTIFQLVSRIGAISLSAINVSFLSQFYCLLSHSRFLLKNMDVSILFWRVLPQLSRRWMSESLLSICMNCAHSWDSSNHQATSKSQRTISDPGCKYHPSHALSTISFASCQSGVIHE